MTVLALLSGGLDSSTAAYDTGAAEAVFIDYGQRHVREFESACAIAAALHIDIRRIDLRAYGGSVASVLTTPGAEVPHGHYAADTMRQTVVPGRNAVMLSVAAGIAASQGHDTVAVGVHAGDHPIYPDCRPEFIGAMGSALWLGYHVNILAPFLDLTKADIARRAVELRVPVALTWSCYEGGHRHCGRCGTCVERREAFHLAGLTDPTTYVDTEFWAAVTW